MSDDGSPHNDPVTTAEAPAPRPYANGTLTGGGGDGGGGAGVKQSKAGEEHGQEQGQQREQQERPLKDVCKDIHDRVHRFLRIEPPSGADGDVIRRTQKQTRISQGVIQRALLEYGFEHLSFSYNGGKDCLVLLLLYLSVLWTHFAEKNRGETKSLDQDQHHKSSLEHTTDTNADADAHTDANMDAHIDFPSTIATIYAEPADPFPAVTSFVASSSRAYHLSLTHIRTNPRRRPTAHQTANNALPHPQPPSHTYLSQLDGEVGKEEEPVVTFRDAFAQYLDHNSNVKAIFVGTRRTDPHGHKLTFFDMTDGLWPRFMRIHPVLEWKLDEIWCFLRSPELGSVENGQWKGLDYCSMYDQGYTSLGGTGDTLRNPRLKVLEPDGGISWRPAYQMVDDERERDGRE